MRTKEEKQAIVADLKNKFEEAKGVVFLNLSKLSSPDLFKIKREIKETDEGSFVVSKKTLINIAHPNLALDTVNGPFALVFDYAGNLRPFSILGKHKDEYDLEVYGGLMEGQDINADEVWKIAKLPPREQMYAQLVGVLMSPLSRLARTAQSPLQKLHSVLTQIATKK